MEFQMSMAMVNFGGTNLILIMQVVFDGLQIRLS